MKTLLHFTISLLFIFSAHTLGGQVKLEQKNAWVKIHLEAAISHIDSGNYKIAEKILDSLVIRKDWQNDEPLKVAVYYQYGNALRRVYKYDQALANFTVALEVAERIHGVNHPITIEIYAGLGLSFMNKENYETAIGWFQRALTQVQKRDYHLEGYLLSCMALTLSYSGKEKEAIEGFELSINIFNQNPPHRYAVFPHQNLGNFYESKRNFGLAIEHYEKALEIREKYWLANQATIAHNYKNLSTCYGEYGDLQRASVLEKKSLALFIDLYGENNADVAWGYTSLAYYSWTMGVNLRQGVQDAQKAISIFTKLGQGTSVGSGLAYNHLGICYQNLGEVDKSIEIHLKALEIRIKVLGENHSEVASSYNNLGVSHLDKGELEEALFFFRKAIRIWVDSEYLHPYTALAYNNLAYCLSRLGRHEEVYDHCLKSVEIYSSPRVKGHYQEYLPYSILGTYFIDQRNYAQSFVHFKKALELAKKHYPIKSNTIQRRYNDIIYLCLIQNKLDSAQIYIDSAFYALNYVKDLPNFDPAAQKIDLLYSLQLEATLLEKLYANTNGLQYLERLRINTQKNIELIDFVSKNLSDGPSRLLLLSKNYKSFERLIWSELKSTRRENLLFNTTEKSKALNLIEAFNLNKARSFAGIPEMLLEKENNLRVDISSTEKLIQAKLNANLTMTDSVVLELNSLLYNLKEQHEGLKKQFESEYPAYYRLKYDLSVIDIEETQTLLADDQTLLEYFVGDSSIFVFVVNKKGFHLQELAKNFPLEDWVQQMRKGIYAYQTQSIDPADSLFVRSYDYSAKQYVEAARKLYDQLIAPIKDKLSERVVVVPDGVLGYLPFQALLKAKPNLDYRFNSHQYLGLDHQFSYCYSATLLREMMLKQHKKTPQKPFLAVAPFYDGNLYLQDSMHLATMNSLKLRDLPTPRSNPLSPLKHSGEEAYQTSLIWNGNYLNHKNATKEQFTRQAHEYRILHLATHSVANDKAGDYSYLAFTEIKDSIENEKLYVKDLYNLQLNADMVVLSACETGIGELQRGEGIISLARAFTYAGAKSIFTTLWCVDDNKTKTLMINFHRYLKNGFTKDYALWKAQKDYLDTFKGQDAHPFYWAPFIGIGDMRKL